MPNVLVVGAQWGDEGKGRVVDHLAARAAYAVRFGGGANAGHTLVVNGQKTVLHLIPAGALNPNCRGLIGNGCVADPAALRVEIDQLRAAGVPYGPDRLGISGRVHVVTAFHRAYDRAEGAAIGTTGRGIGPCYTDKAARRGVRLIDVLDGLHRPVLEAQRAVVAALHPEIALPSVEAVAADLEGHVHALAPYVVDVPAELEAAMRADAQVLFEGAQGAGLDVDHGTYPFVTSSHTTAGGVTNGVGVYVELHRRIGVAKAYCTRVGHGPFPTEVEGETGDFLRKQGHEYGSTTGRPRRCGWLDLPALREAVRLSGLTELVITKLDVLSGLPELQMATGHDKGGPIYRAYPGFGEVSHIREHGELPQAAQAFLADVAAGARTPISLVTVGAERGALMTVGAAR